MAEYTEQELKKSIEQGNFSNVYFFYGEEKMLMESAVKKLVHQATGNQFLDFNYQNFDGAFADAQEIVRAAEGLPFMADYKCVIVNDFNVEKRDSADMEEIKELIKNPPESCVLIFYLSNLDFNVKRPGKWGSFITAVNKTGITVNFKRKTNSELEKLLCSAAQKRGCSLSKQNAARILFLSGNDLQTLYNEIEKLCAYTKEGEITKEAIDLNVIRNFETTVFLLANAIVAGNYSKNVHSIACAYERVNEGISGTTATTTTRILLMGSSSIATGDYLGNSNILRNGINWLAGKSSSDELVNVGIDLTSSYVQMSQLDMKVWFSILVVAVPLIIFTAGVVVWVRRKNL